MGRYRFAPDQVAAFEPYGSIPLLRSGVRIVHTVQNYPDKIIFWCFGSPKRLIESITALGFHPRASRAQVLPRDGMAFRWTFLVLLVLIWNTLFLLDGFVPWKHPTGPGPYTFLAVAMLFATALGINLSAWFQGIALKPGRSASEVRPVTLLVLAISAIMLIVFGAQRLAS
jgi:hypothetical protein